MLGGMRVGWQAILASAILGAAWPGPEARANGNYSHVWVASDAVKSLPAGDLRDLLARDGMLNVLRNGAMFPDGGYAVSDGYGEISHWEPFHKAYLGWIRSTFAPPWPDVAAQHIAFLMGMVAHGLTDQFYDGMYLQRHEHFDPDNGEAPYGLDGATDSCFAATQGQMDAPDFFVPAADLAPLYAPLGHVVDPAVLEQGQAFVAFAIAHANAEAADPAVIAGLRGFYPWACDHQADPAVPGSPVTCGPAIAAYWQVLWARLDGVDGFEPPLAGTFFSGGSPWNCPRDATSPDSWVGFAMPRGLDPSTVTPSTVAVAPDGGAAHPVDLQVYYGMNSHLVNIKPRQDWAPDTRYTVTVSPPVASWDGLVLGQAATFTFSTGPAPADPGPEAVEAVEPVELVPETAGDGEGPDAPGDADDPGVADGGEVADAVAGPDAAVAGDAFAETGPATDAGDAGGDAAPDVPRAGGGSGGCSAPGAGGIPAFPAGLLLLVPLVVLARVRRGASRVPG